jgi:hypothetical protein
MTKSVPYASESTGAKARDEITSVLRRFGCESVGFMDDFEKQHLLCTQVFNDNVRTERTIGIRAGLAWGFAADATIVYTARGISRGMQIGIEDAKRANRSIEYRELGEAAKAAPSTAANRRRAEIAGQLHDVSATWHPGMMRRR